MCRNILGCQKYISRLKDMDAPAIIQLLYNKDICKCSSCGGKILPLSPGQYHVTPKPHMLCWRIWTEHLFLSFQCQWRLICDAKNYIIYQKNIYFKPFYVKLWAKARRLKLHIWKLTGRTLFNQEKSKLMQTKGQLLKSLNAAFSFAPSSILSLTIYPVKKTGSCQRELFQYSTVLPFTS